MIFLQWFMDPLKLTVIEWWAVRRANPIDVHYKHAHLCLWFMVASFAQMFSLHCNLSLFTPCLQLYSESTLQRRALVSRHFLLSIAMSRKGNWRRKSRHSRQGWEVFLMLLQNAFSLSASSTGLTPRFRRQGYLEPLAWELMGSGDLPRL